MVNYQRDPEGTQLAVCKAKCMFDWDLGEAKSDPDFVI